MKKIVLVAMAFCIALMGFGQGKSTKSKVTKLPVEKAKIDVDLKFDFGETYRTFSITRVDFIKAKEKFIKHLGKPSTNTLGVLEWKNVNIPEIGENLTLTLQDGVVEFQPGGVSYSIFTDKKMKIQSLQNLSSKKFRMLRFTISNAENINAIRNNKLQKEALKFLDTLKL